MPIDKCFYCATKKGPFQEDHVIPFARGGSSLPRNLVLSCVECNRAKSDRLPSEWKPDLPERVHVLEAKLLEWHREVDGRRSTGLSVGMTFLLDTAIGTVVGMDGRGVQFRGADQVVCTVGDEPEDPHQRVLFKVETDDNHLVLLVQDFWLQWAAWSEFKRLIILDPKYPRAFLVAQDRAKQESEDECFTLAPRAGFAGLRVKVKATNHTQSIYRDGSDSELAVASFTKRQP